MKHPSGIVSVVSAVRSFCWGGRSCWPFKEENAVSSFTIDACSFPVLIQPTSKDVLNVFVFSDGRLFATGPRSRPQRIQLGKSVKMNISGTFSLVSSVTGSVTLTFTGPTLLEGGVVNNGRAVFRFDPNGNLASDTVVGRQTDLCAVLS